MSCPKRLPRKNQRIQCGSNPGHLNYGSNTLPLSHAGLLNCHIIMDPNNPCGKTNQLNPGVEWSLVMQRIYHGQKCHMFDLGQPSRTMQTELSRSCNIILTCIQPRFCRAWRYTIFSFNYANILAISPVIYLFDIPRIFLEYECIFCG